MYIISTELFATEAAGAWAPPSSLPPPGQRFNMGSDEGAVERDENPACTIRPDSACPARSMGSAGVPALVCGQEPGEGRISAALLYRR